jgi:hypothetical protein
MDSNIIETSVTFHSYVFLKQRIWSWPLTDRFEEGNQKRGAPYNTNCPLSRYKLYGTLMQVEELNTTTNAKASKDF